MVKKNSRETDKKKGSPRTEEPERSHANSPPPILTEAPRPTSPVHSQTYPRALSPNQRRSLGNALKNSWRKSVSGIKNVFATDGIHAQLSDIEAEDLLSKLQPPITFTKQDIQNRKRSGDRKSVVSPLEAIASSSLVEHDFPYVCCIIFNHNRPSEEEIQVITCIADRKFGLPLLIKFSLQERSLENIEIWLDLEEILKRCPSWNVSTKLVYITQLYSKYISETSVKQVNVGAEMTKAMAELVTGDWIRDVDSKVNPQVTLMQLKSQVMLNLLDSFSRFKETKHFELYKQLIANE